MKKLLGIVFLGLFLSGNAYAEQAICLYKDVLNKKYPCHTGPELKKILENPYFDLMPRPVGVSEEQYRLLIKKRIKEWDAGATQRNKKYEEDRKKRIDLKCEILGGQANNSSSAKKIYKKCMKAEGY